MRPASTFGVLLALLADRFTGKVVGVTDGDTISVMRAGRAVKVRLYGIDCPEGGQDFGRRAKQFTSELVFGKAVRVDVRDTDRYGRLVGRVFVGGTDVNLEIVRAGFAWHYRRYSDDPALARAEQQARFFAIGCLASGKFLCLVGHRERVEHLWRNAHTLLELGMFEAALIDTYITGRPAARAWAVHGLRRGRRQGSRPARVELLVDGLA